MIHWQYMHLLMPVRHRLRRLFLKLLIDDPGALKAPLPGAQTWKLVNMPELELLCVTFPTTNNSSEAGTIDLLACSERLCECYLSGCLKVSLADGMELLNLPTFFLRLRWQPQQHAGRQLVQHSVADALAADFGRHHY